ncbi:MAG: ATP-binding protein [Candidatus Omnitrophota bacterium]
MNPYNFSILCFGFCAVFLGLLVWLKRQDLLGQKYFVFSLTCAAFSLPFANNFNLSTSHASALLTSRLANGFAIFIPVTWYDFALVFIGKQKERKTLIRFLYFFSLVLFCFIFSEKYVTDVKWISGFYSAVAGPLHYFFSSLFFTVVPLSFFELLRGMKTARHQEQQNIKWVAIFVGLSFLGGSFTLVPAYGIAFPQYGLFLMPIYPFALAYFMIKQKLFDVEELAQAAHRDKLTAIGVLAASINHEVKNPLFIIKGLAESCLDRQKEGIFPTKEKALESANDAMKRSVEQADRAMDIIKRLSLFAKAGIDSEIKFEPVNVAQVIEDVLPLVRYELAAHGIALSRDIPPNLPDVSADRRYLEEILFNLIVNACQAIKPNSPSDDSKVNWTSPGNLRSKENGGQDKEGGLSGEIVITATTGATSHGTRASSVIAKESAEDFGGRLRQSKNEIASSSSRLAMTDAKLGQGTGNEAFLNSRGTRLVERVPVVITIQDTGPGIPADKLKDVFRPFYTTKAEGTGLGLYITQQLVEKIRGRIDVHSEIGVGTTFTVLLPVGGQSL